VFLGGKARWWCWWCRERLNTLRDQFMKCFFPTKWDVRVLDSDDSADGSDDGSDDTKWWGDRGDKRGESVRVVRVEWWQLCQWW
jgi:hypothetical protein